MEKMKQKVKFVGLKQSFTEYVLATFILVASLSALIIWGCLSFQAWLVPDSNEVYLTIEKTYANGNTTIITEQIPLNDIFSETIYHFNDEADAEESDVQYSITSVENSVSALTPSRKLAYRGSQVIMIALPVLLSLAGILVCGLLFYNRKLRRPIFVLSQAAEKISAEDLDFHVASDSRNEMGMLCDSFEQMRVTLKENNRQLWDALEDRRRLQSAVAHDLRNPIAIIQGYAQYLTLSLADGKIQQEKISRIADSILQTAQRMERYTDSLRTISCMEEWEIQPQDVDFYTFSTEMKQDLQLLIAAQKPALIWENFVPMVNVTLDSKALYRILENLVGNAVRYAKDKITVRFSLESETLVVTVSDDGPGFPAKILEAGKEYISSESGGDHFGIGLSICQILCRKHGGCLTIVNAAEGGAVVKFYLKV